MALKVQPAYIGQTGYLHPVELDRNLLEGLMQRTGVLRYGDMRAVPTAGTRAVSIPAGRIHIVGQENAQQGSYFAWSDGADTVTFAAATTNPRIDSILVRIYDDQYGVISGSPRAEYVIVQGVASGSPTARPDSDFLVGGSQYVPGAWARIANVRVNVGDGTIPGGQITVIERYVRTPGGMTLCLSTDRPTDAVLGDRCYDIDTGIRRVYNGTAWVQSEPWVATSLLGATTASVTLSSIPTTLKTVKLTVTARHDNASVYQDLLLRIGGDTGANYRYAGHYMQDTALGGFNAIGQTSGRLGFVCGTTVTSGQFTTAEAVFQGWNSPHANNLTALVRSGFTGLVGGHMLTWHGTLTYHGTNAYTSLTVLAAAGSFIAGSQFVLEGWE